MFLKCILLLFILSFVESVFSYYHSSAPSCPILRIKNGRARPRQRGNFLKFYCNAQYTLIGNKYALCRFGQWDVPIPVCVKTGCQQLEEVKNAVNLTYYDNALVVFFCLPGLQLVGSPVLYCDGTEWNSTTPKCDESSTKKTETECNFEQSDICGWKQDEYHDFDWRRLNKKTPSSFLQTGPQYDHTYGKNGSGYYMYIESTGTPENFKARLMSPVYEADVAKDGCFVFWYHMFGRSMGGLMAYQKPAKLSMIQLQELLLQKNAQNYTLFKQWGNQGNEWHKAIAMLSDFGDNFQIVIEGIRGVSFMSDIAIDDVSIQHGENCTKAMVQPTTPPSVLQESCVGRCDLYKEDTGYRGCSCSIVCVVTENCCPDFFDVCVTSNLYQQMSTTRSATEDYSSSDTSVIPPQTEELVATTPETFAPTPSSTTTATTMTTTKRPTIHVSRGPATTNTTTTTTTTTTKMPATTTTATKISATTTIANEIPATTTTATKISATTTIANEIPATTTTATEIPATTTTATEMPVTTTIANEIPTTTTTANEIPSSTTTATKMSATTTIANEIPATTTTATEMPATTTTATEKPATTTITIEMPATNKSPSTSPSTSTTNTTTTPRPTSPRKTIPTTPTSKIVTIDVSWMTYSTISVVRTTMDNAGVKTADVCTCDCRDSGKG